MSVSGCEELAISVVEDEQGLLFLGEPIQVKEWLDEQGLTSYEFTAKAAGMARGIAKVAERATDTSGRWVKLTKESAELVKKYGKPGKVQSGVVQKPNGQIVKWLKFENPSQLFSPAMATGVAGMMTQMAMEQAIQEITDYLARIDDKVNDLLRDQKDRVIAELMGASFEVDEAAAIRTKTGFLSDTAWTKLAPCASTTATALAYALGKLQGIAEKMVKSGSVDDLSHVVESAHDDVPAWFAVVACAVKTRDRLSVVELERAFSETPESLEEHREGIVEARRDRLGKVRSGIEAFRVALEQTADKARSEKLLHPFAVDKTLTALDWLMEQTGSFSNALGIEMDERTIERAPAWDKVAGKFVEEVAAGAAGGAQQVGGAIADGAAVFGEAAGKGAAELGSAVAGGAQEIGKALQGVDLGKVTEGLPFKLPFRK